MGVETKERKDGRHSIIGPLASSIDADPRTGRLPVPEMRVANVGGGRSRSAEGSATGSHLGTEQPAAAMPELPSAEDQSGKRAPDTGS